MYIHDMNMIPLTALAEPNRLHIIELLRSKSRSVNEIVSTLQLNQPQVSKHLRVLADAGIVEMRPQAQQRIYRLRPKPFQELDMWLEKYRYLWSDRFDRLDELLKQEKKDM